MKVTIELLAGSDHHRPSKLDIAKNIGALDRAIDGKPQVRDFILMADTKSILEGIAKELP